MRRFLFLLAFGALCVPHGRAAHRGAADFVRFAETPGIWLADDLPDLYR